MKKQSTFLAIIGLVLQMLVPILYQIINTMPYDSRPVFYLVMPVVSVVSVGLLLPFFINLYKMQK